MFLHTTSSQKGGTTLMTNADGVGLQNASPPMLRDRIRRRGFLRLAAGLSLAGAAAPLLGACASSSVTAAKNVNPDNIAGTLEMLGWEGYDGPEETAQWRKSHGLDVKVTALSENDQILSQLRAGGTGRFDLITPNQAYVPLLTAAKVLQPIDIGLIPNAAKIMPAINAVVKDSLYANGQQYGVPYLWGQDGMVYNAQRIDRPVSWNDVSRPEHRKRVVMLGGVTPIMQVWPRVLGYDLKTLTKEQLDHVVDHLVDIIKTQCLTMTTDPFQALAILARGEADIIGASTGMGYPSMAPAGEKLASTMPKEGGATWVDALAIPTKAPNIDAAYGFINKLLSADVQPSVADALTEGVVNVDAIAKVSPQNAAIFPYSSASTIGSEQAPLYRLPSSSSDGQYTTYEDWTKAWQQIQARSV
jgi:spermidine/putrescine-binding protein